MPEYSASQAAALLGISEKTLLRRIKAGTVQAEKVALDTGGLAWRVTLDTGGKDNAIDNAPEPTGARAGTPFEHKPAEVEERKGQRAGTVPELLEERAGTAMDNATDNPSGEVLALLKSENAFLRGMVEQHQRSEAELRASLRAALAAMPKALPEGEKLEQAGAGTETSTPVVPEKEPIEAAQGAQSTPADQTVQVTKQSPQRGVQRRKLTAWQRMAARVLGIR
jgi:hypothetical protein